MSGQVQIREPDDRPRVGPAKRTAGRWLLVAAAGAAGVAALTMVGSEPAPTVTGENVPATLPTTYQSPLAGQWMVVELPGEGRLEYLVAGEPGVVALAGTRWAESAAGGWFSANGLDWEYLAGAEFPLGRGQVASLVYTRFGYLAGGSSMSADRLQPGGERPRPVVAWSPDGRAWTEVVLDGTASSVGNIVETDQGLLALDGSSGSVWRSVDGREWAAAEFAGLDGVIHDIARVGDSYVGVGAIDNVAQVWLSSDTYDWQPLVADIDTPWPIGWVFVTVAPLTGEGVLVGAAPRGDGSWTYFHSDDLTGWRRVSGPGSPIEVLTVEGQPLLVRSYHDGLSTSIDGAEWTSVPAEHLPIRPGPGGATLDERPAITALDSAGCLQVAAGTSGLHPTLWLHGCVGDPSVTYPDGGWREVYSFDSAEVIDFTDLGDGWLATMWEGSPHLGSSDGVHWEPVTFGGGPPPPRFGLSATDRGNEIILVGQLVIVGQSVWTSTDGLEFTSLEADLPCCGAIIGTYRESLYVRTDQGKLMTSTNGQTWTKAAAAPELWDLVVGETGLVGYVDKTLYFSQDGADWEAVDSGLDELWGLSEAAEAVVVAGWDDGAFTLLLAPTSDPSTWREIDPPGGADQDLWMMRGYDQLVLQGGPDPAYFITEDLEIWREVPLVVARGFVGAWPQLLDTDPLLVAGVDHGRTKIWRYQP